MTTSSVPGFPLKRSLITFVAALSAISLACSTITSLVPTAGEEATEPGAEQGEAPPEALEAQELPAVLGFVLDPDGAAVANAAVGDEITDSNGAVSGELTGSASGWLEVKEVGSVTGYAMPADLIGETMFFEARLTPFEVFRPLESGKEVVLALGDAAQPIAEVTIPDGATSALPAYVEAAAYDLVDVGPRLAELSSGEERDLVFAVAVQAISNGGDAAALAAGKSITVTVFPNPTLPASLTLAVFDAQAGVWRVQEGGCTPAEAGGVECPVPQFAPLIGLFGPHVDPTASTPSDAEASASVSPAGRGLYRQTPTDDDQAYQDAKTDCAEWLRIGEGQINRTGSVSAEWEAEMTNRIGRLADAAEAYADTHPDSSGIAHLLGAAQAAILTGNQPIADKLLEEAKAVAEAMADELLKESDCGRFREMLLMAQQLILLGSQAKADALIEKTIRMLDCDIWSGTIYVWLNVASNPPRLDWALESGGGTWMETHDVKMTTNVQTYVLKGEDRMRLSGSEVMHGEKDDHGCHTYMTHNLDLGGGPIVLNFDGRYDGYTFTVGDLKSVGGSSSIIYGAHGERWDDEEEKCEVIDDQSAPAPNYTSVLLHGFSGSPPITMQEMLQGGDNTNVYGREEISNDAYELFIFPVEDGHVIWSFYHAKKVLPVKQ